MTSAFAFADLLDPYRPLFRRVAADLTSDPSAWHRLWDVPILRALAHMGIDPALHAHPLPADLAPRYSFVMHLQVVEHLASLSASAMMALPGASLSCHAVQSVGTPEQKAAFFAPFRAGDPVQSFFAVTEPEIGSDVSQARCAVTQTPAGRVLSGTKTLIGGAAKAQVGLVYAAAPGAPFGEVILVTEPAIKAHLHVEPLAMFGLEGAGLCRITFRDLPAPKSAVLGGGRSRLHGGMNALSKVFERHRPMVAAMALGTARALMTELERAGHTVPVASRQRFDVLYAELGAIGAAYDARHAMFTRASALKFATVAMLGDLCGQVPGDVLVHNPELRLLYRSAKAFEYMEGTSNIHLLNAAGSLATQLGAANAA